ncbi:FKBP-type peptidyl-prolyl cis-trans isomerase [Geomesophilobacter sediminis]|uniref:Peptidyl-prolyl cis-trans isomerase n=1 Tax=Geomesophilobacter sediminis TaxID=2798584 RepID=A0A8J7IKZ5_9BACT|nr:peptidylprolyl isomerase [Geomesophilobacter sediminis]MBJ6723363.1 peptidylprolyl isomerase [Geomesophilobacter sediminis]
MSILKAGSRVTVHYIGTLDNGKIFDSTPDDEPLVFTIGANEVFPALEAAVAGMAPGEVRNIVVAAAEAYGPRRKENVIRVDRNAFPAGRELRLGQKLAMEFNGGASRVMMITEIGADEVTLDGNHPLAGQDLTFALRLVSVEEG